jgi:hypothetical protein
MKFKRLLAFMVTSTQSVGHGLLVGVAKKENKLVEVIDCDCSDVWKNN